MWARSSTYSLLLSLRVQHCRLGPVDFDVLLDCRSAVDVDRVSLRASPTHRVGNRDSCGGRSENLGRTTGLSYLGRHDRFYGAPIAWCAARMVRRARMVRHSHGAPFPDIWTLLRGIGILFSRTHVRSFNSPTNTMEHDLDLTAPYRAEDRSAEQSLTALSHLAEQSAKITAVVARGQENVNVGYMILGFQPDLDRSSQQTREKWQSIRSGVGALMQANQQMFYNMADIVKELRQIASRCAQLQEDIESSTLNQAQAKAALAMIDQVLKNGMPLAQSCIALFRGPDFLWVSSVESAREHVNGITRLDSDLFEKVASDSSSFLKEVGAEWVTLKSNTIRELRQRLDDLDREEIAK